MPRNRRESLIFTVMMCFVMVLWMSIFNVSMVTGHLNWESVREGWLGFPLAFGVAACCDWFIVSRLAKAVAFRYLVKPESSELQKALVVSTCMVVPMVLIMSGYGAVEACLRYHAWDRFLLLWLGNIPRNFLMALPLQLLIAGPVVRFLFRRAFPVGKILE